MTDNPDIDALLERCFEVFKSKGADYSRDADRLYNFRSVAKFTGLNMKQVWSVFYMKHVLAILAYVKGGTESEPIEDRIVDAINYLCLFSLIVREAKPR